MYLPICVFYLSVYLNQPIYPSIYLVTCLSFPRSCIQLSIYLSICLSICLSFCPSNYLASYRSLSSYLSICLATLDLATDLSIYLQSYPDLPACLRTYRFIYRCAYLPLAHLARQLSMADVSEPLAPSAPSLGSVPQCRELITLQEVSLSPVPMQARKSGGGDPRPNPENMPTAPGYYFRGAGFPGLLIRFRCPERTNLKGTYTLNPTIVALREP